MGAASSIEYSGVHHLAFVCKDMEKTVEFYTNILNMKLVKGFDIPGGQHFFFDMGGTNLLAFFWFSDAPDAAPGIASVRNLLGKEGGITSAHGSMNHVAFHAPLDKIEGIREELISKGVDVSDIVNHADIETKPGVSRTSQEVEDDTWLRSIYFLDPDGIMLEFCSGVNDGTPDVSLPVNAEGIKADGRGLDGG